MKKFYTLLAAVVTTATFAQTPLNTNGSLENWPDETTQPEGWFMSNANLSGGIATKMTGEAQDGTTYVKLAQRSEASGNNNIGLQDVAVTPGQTYTISYWYKSESDTFNFKHWAQWRTAVGGGDNIAENVTTFQPSESVMPNAGEWKLVTATETAPDNANAIRLNFRNYTGSSAAFIDNVTVYEGTPASIKQDNIDGLAIYPNPANDIISIASNGIGIKAVTIFDLVGKKVIETSTNQTVNVSSLKAGVYLVNVKQDGKSATRKLVIK